ncbi:MAG: GTPase HflX [Robiginitomaculum sp.]|nr:MAG: GTPase HflX [Robiginitomaculum sp.]
MIPVDEAPQSAIVIHPVVRSENRELDPENGLNEAVGLTLALDLVVSHAQTLKIKKIIPATFLGGGAIEQLKDNLQAEQADLLIFNGQLTPVQQRNLEERLHVKVLDRTGLILEIFSKRARTKEGRLQVELARISYERSRLVRTWTHLERQRGGKGFLAGPGERQIESDRRALSEKAISLGRLLEKVRRTRQLHRQARVKRDCPMIALVGYTNAGKSTLFNQLTEANVLVEDMLFATLDPTIREIILENNKEAVLSDTVGFISNLPTELIAAFRATLEEVTQADLILHVRDIASAQTLEQKQDVESVLKKLKEEGGSEPKMLEVWNKIDLLSEEDLDYLRGKAKKMDMPPVLISAETGVGLDALLERVSGILQTREQTIELVVPSNSGAALSWLHTNGQVLSCEPDEFGDLACVVKLNQIAVGRFQSAFPKLLPAPNNSRW